jgi:NADH:ubiquinone oxidoreductase subunit B-like Fe-S oxidoreductase
MRNAPQLVRLYQQNPDPKYVIAREPVELLAGFQR